METPQDLASVYSPKEVEEKWYPFWESKGFFTPEIHPPRLKPYTIVIPPPNVTGILHMGHALNNTIQDILIRWQRMKGVPTLWLPGTDHAGIATQNVVEKKLAGQGKTRFDLGRGKFVEEVWQWKKEYGSTIVKQLRRLGASCDWTRERFTMDEGLSRAVRHAFVKLYEQDLIYQGDYIINWCPRCQTALSDEEAPYQEVEGKLYYYHYLVRDAKTGKMVKDNQVIIATTRPETMLGDTALAVNSKDKRYRGIEKKEIYLPFQNRRLPVIKDELIDPEFGTGIVKVTPAHDPNDFVMGHRHNLEFKNILYPDGRVNDNGAPYQNLDRFEARKRIIEDLKKEGLFEKEVPHRHAVPHCYRCHTVVEPYLSKQWFVKMKPLTEKALEAHAKGEVKIFPERWNKVYTNWLKNIRDWCISRQIWWGHQIPVWYCDECIKKQETRSKKQETEESKQNSKVGVIVSMEDPVKCPECGHTKIRRDEDVLDTWFSSWLWPFSTLGWPDKTKDLDYFYPTSDLVTAPEILFFWVARMIMAGLKFMGEVPFRNVLIHGTVRAQSGLKMSKSLGNAIDPLEVIDEMGADALRQSLVMLAAQDVYLSREKFEVGRNFTNKIWNAARFVFMNLADFKEGQLDFKFTGVERMDAWILLKLQEATQEIEKLLRSFEISQAATAVYHFVWNDFCDWYLELAKANLAGPGRQGTQQVLFNVLEKTMRLLHPFMPFISEEIWQMLKKKAQNNEKWPQTLMFATWPLVEKVQRNTEVVDEFNLFQEVVNLIRNLRANLNISPRQFIKQAIIRYRNDHAHKALREFEKEIKKLGYLESLEFKQDFQRSKSYVGSASREFEVFISIEGVVDPEKEKQRIEKKIQNSERYLDSIRKKLENPKFVENAPQELVDEERGKLLETEELLKTHREHLELFQ